jgi:hypothetical protein
MEGGRENPLPADRNQWRIEADKVQPEQWTARDRAIPQDGNDHRRAWMDLTSKLQGIKVYRFTISMNERIFSNFFVLARKITSR